MTGTLRHTDSGSDNFGHWGNFNQKHW